jgi:serine protease AprX
LFSFAALAENTHVSDKINTDGKISATLSSKIAEASATEQIPVIIRLKNQDIPFNTAQGISQIDNEQKNLLSILNKAEASNKAQSIKSTHIVNAIAAKVTPDLITSLAIRPEVSKIESDEIISIAEDKTPSLKVMNSLSPLQSNAWGVDKIGAPFVWQNGITGKGITVAIIDTGIDNTHPDLDDLDDKNNTNDSKVVGWIDYINGLPTPYDDHWHGTHVAGTISGTGSSGIHTGVAPGTKLIVAKVFDSYGYGLESDVILAFEWAVKKGVRIISFSGGGSHLDSFTIAVDKVVAAGVVPVIAAGNGGPTLNSVSCPGDESNSTTIGATDIYDRLASFSSRGPVDLYGLPYSKPDVSAPGLDITSTIPVRYGSSYGNASGTSMATPHVSGTVALMLEKNPTLKPSEIKNILESSSIDLGLPGRDNDFGSGRIEAYKAVFYKSILPAANFSSNVAEGFVPLSVQFIDHSQSATGWNWNFGDKTSSTEQNPIHTYTTAGSYTVTLIASNGAGKDTKTKTSYIKVKSDPLNLVTAFSASPTSGKVPLKVQFTDKSSGSPTSWKWSFGDGKYSTQKNPSHTYSKTGKYNIALTVRNTWSSNTKTIYGFITVSKKM